MFSYFLLSMFCNDIGTGLHLYPPLQLKHFVWESHRKESVLSWQLLVGVAWVELCQHYNTVICMLAQFWPEIRLFVVPTHINICAYAIYYSRHPNYVSLKKKINFNNRNVECK